MSDGATEMHSGERLMMPVVAVCALTLPLSFYEAGWAPRSGALLFVCLLGLACGILIGPLRLARPVRWPVVAAAALVLAMSNAGLFNISPQAARIRMTSWAMDLAAGRVVEDPALVAFWTTLLIWWAGYSATHGITSGGRAFEALLPTTAALTINLIYTRLSPLYISVIVSGLVILIAWTTQGRHQANWSARRLDYPDLWPEWMGSGLFMAAVVCALAMLAAPLTSPTTIGWISRALEWPASQARHIASLVLGGANPIASGARSVAILPNSRLITDPPQLLEQVVMWVWTNEPPPLPENESHTSIARPGWRGLTYSTYNGRGWSNPALASRPLSFTLSGDLVQRFEIVAEHGDTLFAANRPLSGDAGLHGLYRSGADTDLIGLRGASSYYTVTSRSVTATMDTLRQSPIVYSPEITPYLQLPTGLPQRVRDLAVQVTASAATPFDKAARIESFLRTYPYTLDLPPVPQGRDLVDYFLFEAPGGYCDYYASAMVVMLRATGVPARLASGYARGAYDYERNAFRVLGTNAHSWPEVYFEGVGWVEFEPTAIQPTLTRTSESQPAPESGVSAGDVRAAQSQRQRLTAAAWGAATATLLAAGALVWLARRERQLGALPAEQVIPLLYQRLRRLGGWLGVTVRPGDTPDEFLTALGRLIEQRAARGPRWQAQAQATRRSAAHLGELYVQASYSPRKPGAQEARRALEAWRGLRLRIWLWKFQISLKPGSNRST
jgi:transglutaminase-like putative cysteine protease